MWGPGGASCIIRFICHIPTGMVGFQGIVYYKAIKDYGSIFDVIPEGHALLDGTRMIAIAGIITFVWNFIQFGASPFCKGILLGTVGLVDLGLAIALICGVAKQAKFLPGTYASCNDAADWMNGTDGRNFFVYANGTSAFSEAGSPYTICHEFVETWIMAIVVIIFYLICTLLNTILGFGAGDYRSRRSFGSPSQFDCDCDGCSGPCVWLCIPFLLMLKPFIWMADHGVAVCRFGARYLLRSMAARRRSIRSSTRTKRKKPKLDEKISPQTESQVLPHEILVMIARKVHHSDLVSVSRSSKRLRGVFFGEASPSELLPFLRQYTCRGSGKSACEVCETQICTECQVQRHIPESTTSLHLSQCQPYCSSCYYTTYCRWNKGSWFRSARHKHNWCRLGKRRDMELRATLGTEKAVCQSCAVMPDAELRTFIESKEARESQRLGIHPLSCAKCQNQLATSGPRWWHCSVCQRECPARLHPKWA